MARIAVSLQSAADLIPSVVSVTRDGCRATWVDWAWPGGELTIFASRDEQRVLAQRWLDAIDNPGGGH